MKIKFVIPVLLLLESIMAGHDMADNQTKIVVSLKDTNLKTIEVVCPDFISVGPTNLQSGWESTSVFPMSILSMKIKLAGEYTHQQMVQCWYGDGKHPLIITYKVPTSYSCKPSDTNKNMAVCKMLWK